LIAPEPNEKRWNLDAIALTFEAFGADYLPGRIAISVRDLARFGLLYLRDGRWKY
jgi:hypothetical protein